MNVSLPWLLSDFQASLRDGVVQDARREEHDEGCSTYRNVKLAGDPCQLGRTGRRW